MEDNSAVKTEKITVQGIVDRIVELIRAGVYLPGTPIREVELCKLFCVSRTPVREALRLLQNSGVVEYIPRCGVQVADMDHRTLLNITETRSVLEVLSARNAAKRITQEELEELWDINEQFYAEPDPQKVAQWDQLLHIRIAEISDNPCIVQFLQNLLLRQVIVSVVFEWIPQRRHCSYLEHKAILQALEMHDSELAAKQADVHFHMSQISLQNKLEKYLKNRTE